MLHSSCYHFVILMDLGEGAERPEYNPTCQTLFPDDRTMWAAAEQVHLLTQSIGEIGGCPD